MKRSQSGIQQEYERWDKAHKRMVDAPPSDGHGYIQHAIDLLELLEPIAEIHPVAKAVVGCFKQLVSFEQDRRENDARVAGVILAQTAMMRVLLDLDDLISRQHDATTLRSMVELPRMLRAVQEDITICHNSIDTYYKEHRLVKFCKAKDWKTRMIEFIETFDRHRVELHQALSLQVASDVTDLVTKMDLLLSRLFTPREPWELLISSRIRDLTTSGKPNWMQDTHTVQALAVDTGDPSVKWDAPADLFESTKLEIQLNQLKEDLQLDLDVLCERNTELFALKLKLHTEQLERAILYSARLVISSLSGPHDRLEHEDLRKLWKDMNWMFCVETKVFGIALFEYYLDLYANGVYMSGFDTGIWMPKFDPVYRYKSGAFKHPEAWTLQYLFLYVDRISNAIDSDNSGFIRISEANAFTSQIPDGWTLPQWCAYLVEGQFHENSLYRKRLTHIRHLLYEMHSEILPHNRFGSLEFIQMIGSKLLHYLILEPRDPAHRSEVAVAPELHELVKEKMLAQDAKFRQMLKSINWIIEGESTIGILSSGRPLETYIFPLLVVLMEYWLDIHYMAKTEVLDLKEWITPYVMIGALFRVTGDHIKSLEKKFESNKDKNSQEDLLSYHGGIWALLKKTDAPGLGFTGDDFETNLVPLLKEDCDRFYDDISFIDEFPLPELTGTLHQRKFSTWDEYKKAHESETLPENPPFTWNPIDDKMNFNEDYKNHWLDLPTRGWACDKCAKEGQDDRPMHCFDCPDFDFCRGCYMNHPAEHKLNDHDFSHTMVARAAWCHTTKGFWFRFGAKAAKQRLLDKIKTLADAKAQASDETAGDDKASEAVPPDHELKCSRCSETLVYDHLPMYVCIEHSCYQKDVLLCDPCAWTNEYPAGTSHRWWHNLLPLDSRTVGDDVTTAQTSGLTQPSTVSVPLEAELEKSGAADTDGPASSSGLLVSATELSSSISDPSGPSDFAASFSKLDSRMSSLEAKVDVGLSPSTDADAGEKSLASTVTRQASMEERMGNLEERMTSVEGKLDAMLEELKKGLGALLAASRS